MNKEEIQDILEELHTVRPEMLPPKGKKLFEAIMSIADERDELLQRNTKAIEYIEKDKKNMDSSGSYVETYTGWKLIPEILEDLSKILKGSEQ